LPTANAGKGGNFGFVEDQGIHEETVSRAEQAPSELPASEPAARHFKARPSADRLVEPSIADASAVSKQPISVVAV
jgi:hypothetical protein